MLVGPGPPPAKSGPVPRSFLIPSLNTLGHSLLSYDVDKQTDKETDKQANSLERHTHADRHSRRG